MKTAVMVLAALVAVSTSAADREQQMQQVQEVTPAHVYQEMGQVTQDVEMIRTVMGRPKLTAPPWAVNRAEPRHVLYQAQVMFRNANRLAVQLRLPARDLPPIPTGEIRPADVIQFVRGAHVQLDRVRVELGIAEEAELPAFVADREPRDMLREVVQASRQLNLMLDNPIRPADVYARLELAAAYVAGALTEDEAAPVYGTLPPFEGGKTPADVYRRMLECLRLVQEVGAERGIQVLQLNLRTELRRRDILPADVYHLATTVLTEIAQLTLLLEAADVDLPPVERPKHIFPSHVYRMAGMLEDELKRLNAKL